MEIQKLLLASAVGYRIHLHHPLISLEVVSHTQGKTSEAGLIYHSGIYKHISVSTHTHSYSLLFSLLESIPLDCPQTLLTVSLAPCWLEPHCFSSWISRARVVFIVPFFSHSLLYCVVKVILELSALPVSLSAAMCACDLSVCMSVLGFEMLRCFA